MDGWMDDESSTYYCFGKMNSQKCELNFVILQTSLAIGSTKFIGIMNQVHCIDNQFNLSFQPISLHVVNHFMIWYPYSQLHKINFIFYIALSHTKLVMCFAHMADTPSTIKSIITLHSQVHKIAHSNYIVFVLFALMYSVQRP